MPYHFEDYIEKASKAENEEDLISCFFEVVKRHGLDRVVVCFDTDQEHLGLKAGVHLIHNCPEDLFKYYAEKHLEKIDPILAYSRTNPTPFKWDETFVKMNLSKKQKEMLHMVAEAGLNHGIYFPLSHGNARAGIGLSSSLKTDNFSGEIDLVTAYCHHFYHALGRFHKPKILKETDFKNWFLTPKETEILTLAAKGKTDNEIGNRLNISPNTVETHFRNIHSKLDASNRTAAVAKAIATRLIKLSLLFCVFAEPYYTA